jgi:hypothetical protein
MPKFFQDTRGLSGSSADSAADRILRSDCCGSKVRPLSGLNPKLVLASSISLKPSQVLISRVVCRNTVSRKDGNRVQHIA